MFKKITLLAVTLIMILTSGIIATQIFGNNDEPVSEGEIQYEMVWLQDGVQFDADGAGWTVQTELGYIVHVETGYLVSYTMQLVECDDHTHTDETSWLDSIFLPNTAYAGHGGETDPSLIDQPIVENLTQPTDFIFGQINAPAINYCQAHYLVARAYDSAKNLPADVDMLGNSLYLSGTYFAPNSDTPQDFIIQTDLANGTVTDLVYNSASVHVAIGAEKADIRVVRDLSSLLDNVDFAEMDDAERGKAVLWQLIQDTHVEIISDTIHH